MSNFQKRTKRASEELEYDAANKLKSVTPAVDYLTWLHDVTVLGYAKNIFLERCQAQFLEYLHLKGNTPREAIKRIEEVFMRLDAINANPE